MWHALRQACLPLRPRGDGESLPLLSHPKWIESEDGSLLLTLTESLLCARHCSKCLTNRRRGFTHRGQGSFPRLWNLVGNLILLLCKPIYPLDLGLAQHCSCLNGVYLSVRVCIHMYIHCMCVYVYVCRYISYMFVYVCMYTCTPLQNKSNVLFFN